MTQIPHLTEEQLNAIIDMALAEDVVTGDVTSEALVPQSLHGQATLLVKARGMLAGGEIARKIFLRLDPSLQVDLHIADGARVRPGDRIATISGRVISILKAERVVLNVLQRLC
ncbi:MAG: nicotinate-nucleotide diphosphorylase (carboxylating), partial [Chloroflexi bacterium]|nr:nicotinate-nucleotide diphosphorylase (carboxylating) [Chloroflexota bacterium]